MLSILRNGTSNFTPSVVYLEADVIHHPALRRLDRVAGLGEGQLDPRHVGLPERSPRAGLASEVLDVPGLCGFIVSGEDVDVVAVDAVQLLVLH